MFQKKHIWIYIQRAESLAHKRSTCLHFLGDNVMEMMSYTSNRATTFILRQQRSLLHRVWIALSTMNQVVVRCKCWQRSAAALTRLISAISHSQAARVELWRWNSSVALCGLPYANNIICKTHHFLAVRYAAVCVFNYVAACHTSANASPLHHLRDWNTYTKMFVVITCAWQNSTTV